MVDGLIHIPLPGRPLSNVPDGGRDDNPLALDHFLAGPENRLVEVAVRGVLDGQTARYNPVVIYGARGTGKSHLAHGLADYWTRRHGRSRRLGGDGSNGGSQRAVYATARTFYKELANAFEVHSVEEFREKYRGCELLVLEDVEQLEKKAAAQEELVHTLDDLLDAGARVIITASDHPTHLRMLSAALQSRLVGGLTAPLLPPGGEVRAVLLRRLARLRRIELRPTAAATLAKSITGTVPRLIEALLEMEGPARRDGGVIDAEVARAYLDTRATRRGPRIREIAAHTARYFSLKVGDLRGPSRQRNIVTARGVAMYLAREMSKANYQEIGREFGGRDHTTVIHGCRKIKGMVKTDPAIRKAVEQLQLKLEENS